MNRYLSIQETGLVIGVTSTTLRRWEKSGLLKPHHRTLGNHRRYDLQEILKIFNLDDSKPKQRKTICYARVSSHDQKEDLDRQSKVLMKYISDNQIINTEYINDIGSGLNFKKKGLNRLINMILSQEIDKIILTHKDRLLRFGSDLLINIAKHFDIQVVILNQKTKSFEEELSSDVLEIITVFSAKLYGSRSHKNKKIVQN